MGANAGSARGHRRGGCGQARRGWRRREKNGIKWHGPGGAQNRVLEGTEGARRAAHVIYADVG